MALWPETRARGYIQLGLVHADGLNDPVKAVAYFRQALEDASPQERPLLLEQVPRGLRGQVEGAAQTSASSR
jgi:hypothetical protein